MQNLEWIIPFVIFVFIANIWLDRRPKSSKRKTKPVTEATLRSFQRVPSLFVNAPERIFFQILLRDLPDDLFIMSKVRLEDIIRVKPGIRNGEIRWKLRQRVSSRHVDFLIINEQGHPIIAIELDGKSHGSANSRNADELKDGLFKNVGIPLRRVIVGEDFQLAAQEIVEFVNIS